MNTAPRRPCPRDPNGHQGSTARISEAGSWTSLPSSASTSPSIGSTSTRVPRARASRSVTTRRAWRRWSSAWPPSRRRWSCSRPPAAWRFASRRPWPPPAPRAASATPRGGPAFGGATGRLAKTDRLDAEAIARFAEAVRPPARPLPDEATRRLGALVARRRQLLEMLVAERNRRHAADPALHEGIDAHLRWLEE